MTRKRPTARQVTAYLFIDYRGWTEYGLAAVLVVAFLVASGASNFEETLDKAARAAMYGSLAGTSGALLGFVLAALAILVALPSTERLEALREHPKWPRVPSSYLRAARALLAAVVLCSLGILLDSAKEPWKVYEVATVVVLALALVRVTAAVVALDQVVAVARKRKGRAAEVIDP